MEFRGHSAHVRRFIGCNVCRIRPAELEAPQVGAFPAGQARLGEALQDDVFEAVLVAIFVDGVAL
jgi:hypothetical protein